MKNVKLLTLGVLVTLMSAHSRAGGGPPLGIATTVTGVSVIANGSSGGAYALGVASTVVGLISLLAEMEVLDKVFASQMDASQYVASNGTQSTQNLEQTIQDVRGAFAQTAQLNSTEKQQLAQLSNMEIAAIIAALPVN